jgi:phosphoribosylamine--glycine ligase
MVDALEDAGIRAFGPWRDAAIIESSKVFSKNLMREYGIPTARFEVFSDFPAAREYILNVGAPIVVKADGLALGKGVTVALNVDDAISAAKTMMLDRKFGDSGTKVVIEEYMSGAEVTVLAFTDGESIVPMPSSRDHKRAFDHNLGPNTGGMGAICPAPGYTWEIADVCMETIFRPTIKAMDNEGRCFKGVIYFGLMLTPQGPRVVEYNARFGDPEAQAILPLLETNLLDIFEAVTDGRLDEVDIKWKDGAACCVVLASGGYPGTYETGYPIAGLDALPDGVTAYHAGTALADGGYVTKGGRVLGVTATAASLGQATALAYEGVGRMTFKDAHYRTDIGK